jgi:GH43 family beta-xylosidase/lysophospholipase L1-like esterase
MCSTRFIPADESWFHSHVSLERDAQAIRPWRLPFREIELYTEAWWIDWTLIQQAGNSTGVRLRFKTNATSLRLECLPLEDRDRLFDVVIANQCVTTTSLKAGDTQVELVFPNTDEAVEIWLPHNTPCAVSGITLDSEASLAPCPDDRPTLAVYGSSITHCQGAHSPSRTWPGVAGRLHNLQVINLGFSGQCHLHSLVARVLRDLSADYFLIKPGINIYGANSLNGHTFMPNLAGTIQLIRERHPRTPIAVVSPIIRQDHENRSTENAVGMSMPKFREQISDTVNRIKRVCGDKHLHYFDGLMLFGKGEAQNNQPDGCHPDADGYEILGQRAATFILTQLLKTPSPTTRPPKVFNNPVFPEYLADPFCFYHEGTYYAIGTGREEGKQNGLAEKVIPMVKSTNLQDWKRVGRVMTPPKDEFGLSFWAPEIAVHEGRFYLYYQACGSRKGFRIRVAVADHPEGPYVDTGVPLTDVDKNRFCIDAHPFRDDDGQWYLYYATDFPDHDEKTFRGTALVVDRMKSMTELEGNPQLVMRAHWSWQCYEKNRDMLGEIADWYTLEGPTVLKRLGRYYCLYSGGCYQNETYGVDWLVADNPLGPWTEVGCEKGPQLLRTIPGRLIGPGHNSVVTSPDGQDYIVYHAWNEALSDRLMHIDLLDWEDDGPVITRLKHEHALNTTLQPQA